MLEKIWIEGVCGKVMQYTTLDTEKYTINTEMEQWKSS